MGDTRDLVAEMYEKLVFPSLFNDFLLIVRFQWWSSLRPVCVSRRPAGADRKPKELQWFPTVPYVGVGFRGSGSFWMFVDRPLPFVQNH